MKTWFAHGKLLLTGEYLVMEGAEALALPVRPGQSLSVDNSNEGRLHWYAIHPGGKWFDVEFSLPGLEIVSASQQELGVSLQNILKSAKELSGRFLQSGKGYTVKTVLDFLPDSGLGSSSTLVSNLSAWSKTDPYLLQQQSFGGSGYDIACALAKKPILFQLRDGVAQYTSIHFKPSFREKLFFVHLGKKQNSRSSIADFKKNAVYSVDDIERFSSLSRQIAQCDDFDLFKNLIIEHEQEMSNILKCKPVKELLFPDFPGVVKSLGAWGGDFVMMATETSKMEVLNYIQIKGLRTVFGYDDLIL